MSSSQALAAAFLIDSFNVPSSVPPGFPPSTTGSNPIYLNGPGQSGTNSFTGLDKTQVIGGSREINFTQTTSLAPGLQSSASVYTGSGSFDGFFNVSNANRTNSVAELSWNDIGAMGQGNFNVLTGANDEKGIEFDFFTDGIPFKFTLIVSDGTNMSMVSDNYDYMGVQTEGKTQFSFEQILAGGPVDLSNVNYVKLIVEGNLGYDLDINQIGTYEVPEPSTLLGLLAVLGTGAFSLKRKTKEK